MINPFSTPNRKDSSIQTMKRRLCRRLSGTKLKPSIDFDNKTLWSLSDSDCSTLVDYDLEDVVADDTSDSFEGEFLPFDEQSWTRRSTPEQSRIPRSDVGAFRLYVRERTQPYQQSLLDEEDCSWVMPRPSGKSVAVKSRFALFARRSKHVNSRAGLEPQLLDPEERSWM